MKRARLTVAIAAFVTATPILSQVQNSSDDSWKFEATPYFWAAGVEGWSRIGARTPTAHFDANFSDVFRNLDFGAMGSFEARKGRWGILFDGIYIKLSQTSEPLLGGSLGTEDLSAKQTILQLAGAYRVFDGPSLAVDVLAGVRYTYVDGDISLSTSALLPNGLSRGDHASWTDGFGGVRAVFALTDKWSFTGYLDGGAGGTKHSWQFLASANYTFSKTFVAKAGYRILSMDYEKPDFLYNMRTRGFFAGVGIRF
ncbi:hypothetical protein LJR267_009882 [Paraburkholderia hospita]|jgi:hypothetical protein|uniref:hypothetical protein n=1 Tax=Paraburkholderia hospita TaxID=169430 RepID=UPI003ED02216